MTVRAEQHDKNRLVTLCLKSGSLLMTEIGSDRLVSSDLDHSCCKKKKKPVHAIIYFFSV
jgi:hypothetical protein